LNGILDGKEELFRRQQAMLTNKAPVLIQIALNMPGGYTLYPWSVLFDEALVMVKGFLRIRGITIRGEDEVPAAHRGLLYRCFAV
jgi:phosphoribosyl-dephospho-CoA transferase